MTISVKHAREHESRKHRERFRGRRIASAKMFFTLWPYFEITARLQRSVIEENCREIGIVREGKREIERPKKRRRQAPLH